MSENNNDNAIRALPCWTGEVDIAPLSGGITNRKYRVSDRSGQQFVVRIGRDTPEHGVLRFNERAAARAAGQRLWLIDWDYAGFNGPPLRESLWGAVSRLTSTLEFDYAGCARDYLRRFEQRWQDFQSSRG